MTLNRDAMLRCYPVTQFINVTQSHSHTVTLKCHADARLNYNFQMIRRYADTPKTQCNAKTQTLFYSPEEIKKRKDTPTRRHADLSFNQKSTPTRQHG